MVAKLSKVRKISFGILGVFSFSLSKLSIQILMFSSCGMLVNRKLTSIPAIDKLGCRLQVLLPRLIRIQIYKKHLNKVLLSKSVVSTVPHDRTSWQYYHIWGNIRFKFETEWKRLMKNKLPYCNSQILFQTKGKFINFSHSKIKLLFSYVLALFINSSVVGGCNAIYYGKTKRHLKVQMWEHLGVSDLTGEFWFLTIFPYYPGTTMTLSIQ